MSGEPDTDSRDDLVARAKARAEAPVTPEEWGYRVALDEGESFVGSWGGETTDPDNDDRPVYLLEDEDGDECFSRHYAALAREVKAALERGMRPGDKLVLFRGENYRTQYDERDERSGFSIGLDFEPSEQAQPQSEDLF